MPTDGRTQGDKHRSLLMNMRGMSDDRLLMHYLIEQATWIGCRILYSGN